MRRESGQKLGHRAIAIRKGDCGAITKSTAYSQRQDLIFKGN
jgi:hypothetical protein